MAENGWQKAFLLPSAISLIGGIFLAFQFLPDMPQTSCYLLYGVGLFIAIICRLYFKSSRIAIAVIASVIGFYLGFSSRPAQIPVNLINKTGTITGKIKTVRDYGEYKRIIVKGEDWVDKGDSISQNVDFTFVSNIPSTIEVIPGAGIILNGKIREIASSLDVPYQTDFNRFMFIDGATAFINAYATKDINIDNSTANKIDILLGDLRKEWIEAVSDAGFNNETTGFMLAVLAGEQNFLNEDLERQFRDNGLAHVLAISGMHVGIILAILSLLLYPVRLFGPLRYLYYALLALIIIGYSFVTGGSPSALRAAIMCAVFIGDKILECKSNAVQSLSASVIFILCIKPLWLFLPGFQFSVCAVLALIAFSPLLKQLKIKNRALRRLCFITFIPVIAAFGTLVPILFYFHTFPVSFWISNIVGSMFVAPLVALGFCASLLSLVGLKLDALPVLSDFIYETFVSIENKIATFFTNENPSLFLDNSLLIVIGGLIIILAWLCNNYSHRKAVITAIASIIALIFIPQIADSKPTTEIYIPRHTSSTDIILIHKGHNLIWTTANDSLSCKTVIENHKLLYHDFYKLRGISDTPYNFYKSVNCGSLIVKDNFLEIDSLSILRLDNEPIIPPNRHIDYLLVSHLFTGDIVEAATSLSPDTVLLAASIHPSRNRKFVRHLEEHNIIFKSLKEKGAFWQFP